MEAFFKNYDEQASKAFQVLERKNAISAYLTMKRQRYY